MKKFLLIILTCFLMILPVQAQEIINNIITITGTENLGKITTKKTIKYEIKSEEDIDLNKISVSIKDENKKVIIDENDFIFYDIYEINDNNANLYVYIDIAKMQLQGNYTVNVKYDTAVFVSNFNANSMSTLIVESDSGFGPITEGTLTQNNTIYSISKKLNETVTLPTVLNKDITIHFENTNLENINESLTFNNYITDKLNVYNYTYFNFTTPGSITKLTATYTPAQIYLPIPENKSEDAVFIGYYTTPHDDDNISPDKEHFVSSGDETITVSSDMTLYARYQKIADLKLTTKLKDDFDEATNSYTARLTLNWNENDLIDKYYRAYISDDGTDNYKFIKTNGLYNNNENNIYYHNGIGEASEKQLDYYAYQIIPNCDNLDVIHRTCYHSLSSVDITNQLYENNFASTKTITLKSYNAINKKYEDWNVAGEFVYAYKDDSGKYNLSRTPVDNSIKLYKKVTVFIFQSTNYGCTNKINDKYAKNVMYYWYVPVEEINDDNFSSVFGIKDIAFEDTNDTVFANQSAPDYKAYFSGYDYLCGEILNKNGKYPTFDYYVNGVLSPGYNVQWHDVVYKEETDHGFVWNDFTDESSEYQCLGHPEYVKFENNEITIKNGADTKAPLPITEIRQEYSKTSHEKIISFDEVQDEGVTFKVYVASFEKREDLPLTQSSVQEITAFSGLDNYIYVIDDTPDTVLTSKTKVQQTNKTTLKIACQNSDGEIIPVQYLHIAPVDNIGNIGQTTTAEIIYAPQSEIIFETNDLTWQDNTIAKQRKYTNTILNKIEIPLPKLNFEYTINYDVQNYGTLSGPASVKTYRRLTNFEKIYPFYGDLTNHKEFTYSDGKKITLPTTYTFFGYSETSQTLKAVYKNDTLTLPNVEADENHYFMGWYKKAYSDTDADPHNDTYVGQAGDVVSLPENVTLYARFSTLSLTATPEPNVSYNKYRKYTNENTYQDLNDTFIGLTKLKWYQNDFEEKIYKIQESVDGTTWYPVQEYEGN